MDKRGPDKVHSTVILLGDYSAIQIRYRWLAAALQYGTPPGPLFPTAVGNGTSRWPFRMRRWGLRFVLAFGSLLSLLALLLLFLLLLLLLLFFFFLLLPLLDEQEVCSLGLLC